MGVQSLWDLLGPTGALRHRRCVSCLNVPLCAHRVRVSRRPTCTHTGSRLEIQALSGKRVAVGASDCPKPGTPLRALLTQRLSCPTADASIWLVQFVKVRYSVVIHSHLARASQHSTSLRFWLQAMRDERGEVVPNAHLLGFFRRIVRLLCNRIRPVFVFDGETPAMKRQTVAARRRQRAQADVKLKRVAEKLLLSHVKQHLAVRARVLWNCAARGMSHGLTKVGATSGKKCGQRRTGTKLRRCRS